jgi:hypothetical protein
LAEEAEREKQEAQAEGEFSQTRGILWLWTGLLAAPFAFLLHLQVNYVLVQKLCEGGRMLILHLVTIAFLLIASGGAFIAWRNWQAAGRAWPGEEGSVAERSRFMAAVGFLMSILFILAIIAQWIPEFMFPPCER